MIRLPTTHSYLTAREGIQQLIYVAVLRRDNTPSNSSLLSQRSSRSLAHHILKIRLLQNMSCKKLVDLFLLLHYLLSSHSHLRIMITELFVRARKRHLCRADSSSPRLAERWTCASISSTRSFSVHSLLIAGVGRPETYPRKVPRYHRRCVEGRWRTATMERCND